jgi:tripartite-type tricarboxylate transporter receptor subunit TctC
MINRRVFMMSAAQIAVLAALPKVAMAASWPERPVTLVVPFGAGGGADILARLLSEELGKDLNARFLVDNRPGMSGSIGVDYASKSAPDGYTFVICTVGAQITNPVLFKSLPYDPEKDLMPVVHLSTPPNIMVVHKSIPVSTVEEFIAYAKGRPEPIQFSTTGPGSSSHLSAELFKSMAGIEITPVPYQSSAQAAIDLIAGRVEAAIDSLTSMIAHVQSGDLKLLAVATKERLAGYEDVPTIGETLTGYDASPLLYISAPIGTPADIVAQLNAAVNAVIAKPEINAQLNELGFPPGGGSIERLSEIIEEERAKWKVVIETAGLAGSV